VEIVAARLALFQFRIKKLSRSFRNSRAARDTFSPALVLTSRRRPRLFGRQYSVARRTRSTRHNCRSILLSLIREIANPTYYKIERGVSSNQFKRAIL